MSASISVSTIDEFPPLNMVEHHIMQTEEHEESTEIEIASPDTWVERYGDYLYRYAYSRLRNEDSANDCVQDTLLAGIRAFDKFDGKRDVKFWLRGIMRNKIVDQFRKTQKEGKVDLGEDEAVLESALLKYSGIGSLAPAKWKFDPRNQFDRGEFWEVFQSCVDKLQDPVRQAFVLRMLEEHETEEVCEIMNIEPNYLWVLLHRARKQLQSLIEKEWDPERKSF